MTTSSPGAFAVPMIRDKSGRLIDIHDKPGWKISAFERDEMFQRYLAFEKTPDATDPRVRRRWIRSQAERMGISPSRVSALINEGSGGYNGTMRWWVGCSLPGFRSQART